MRLTNFMLDIQRATVVSGSNSFTADSVDPKTREIKDDIYPWGGDVKSPLHVFQGGSRLFDGNSSLNINMCLEHPADAGSIINSNNTLKMTGTLASQPEPGSEYTWGILMVADSEYKG